MAGIDITSGIASAYGAGELQLQGKVQMTSTLTPVTDNLNVASPLLLSTTGVQITSPLRITTSDASGFYLDAEDAATNNRFSIKRDPSSQQVTLDFASNPGGSTTAIGAIRTFRDGVNLSEAMTFIENGNVGIGTTAPYTSLTIGDTDATAEISSGGPNTHLTLKTVGASGALRFFTIGGGTSTLATTEAMRITSAGNVGIGTSAPNIGGINKALTINSPTNTNCSYELAVDNVLQASIFTNVSESSLNLGTFVNGPLKFVTNSSERMRITSAGDVGIGTTAPAAKLEVKKIGDGVSFIASTNGTTSEINIGVGVVTAAFPFIGTNNNTNALQVGTRSAVDIIFLQNSLERARITANGLTFNGDTAAANALDDYEEGTWTMGVAFGGASVGLVASLNTGTYTKIGRQVTVNGILQLASKGSSSGNAQITGLPFTIANDNANFSTASLWMLAVTFANQHQAYGLRNTTNINLEEVTEAGATTSLNNTDFANNSEIIVSLTYFV